MEQNEIVALKKFMDADLVDQMVEPRIEVDAKSKPKRLDSLSDVYVAYKQEQFEVAKPIPSLPDKDIRISQSGTVVLSPDKRKLRNRDAEIVEAMKTVVDAVEKIADRPINIEFRPEIKSPNVTVKPANVAAPIVNIKPVSIPAPVVNPIIQVQASKDTSNILSAVKGLGELVEKVLKQGPPKVEVNVENELMMPDHEVEIEKVVERDSLNRILRTTSTRKIVKKD